MKKLDVSGSTMMYGLVLTAAALCHAEVGQDGATMKMIGAGQFANVIIENLLKAGVPGWSKRFAPN